MQTPSTHSALTGKQLIFLRGLAHHRRVIITVSVDGLKSALVHEIDATLCHHELIKIRFPSGDREQGRQQLAAICADTGAVLVQLIGKIGVVYRQANTPRIQLP